MPQNYSPKYVLGITSQDDGKLHELQTTNKKIIHLGHERRILTLGPSAPLTVRSRQCEASHSSAYTTCESNGGSWEALENSGLAR